MNLEGRKSVMDFRFILESSDKEGHDEMFKMFIKSDKPDGTLGKIIDLIYNEIGCTPDIFKTISYVLKNMSNMKTGGIVELYKEDDFIKVDKNIWINSKDMDIVKVKDKFIINGACRYIVTDSYIGTKNESGNITFKRSDYNVGLESGTTPIVFDADMLDNGDIVANGRVYMFNVIGKKLVEHKDVSTSIIQGQNMVFPLSIATVEGSSSSISFINKYNKAFYGSNKDCLIEPYFMNIDSIKGVSLYELSANPEKYMNLSLKNITEML